MRPLTYRRPETLGDALALGADPDARYLAGGTNLVDLMKLGVAAPRLVVDVNGVLDTGLEQTDDVIRIGAGMRNTDLAAHPLIRRRYPAVARALLAGASGQVRNAATVGGNLLQRTRCPYFQDVTRPCNKRAPGTGCPAQRPGGASRYLAALGGHERCIATQPGDLPVALAAFDALVVLHGQRGKRRVPVSEFYVSDPEQPDRDSVIEPGELITAVELPKIADGTRSTFLKTRDRASFAFAIVSVAAVLTPAGELAALAFGAVAPGPWRPRGAEAALRGMVATREAVSDAVARDLEQATPTADNAFKVGLARNLAGAAIAALS